MEAQYQNVGVKLPLKSKMIAIVIVTMVPLLAISVYLVIALLNYSNAYDEIVSNMTIANKETAVICAVVEILPLIILLEARPISIRNQ